MNSEGFRETFLRNGRKTQGAKTAGKKDAKQKASPCDRTEKIKEKIKSSSGRRVLPKGAGREWPREHSSSRCKDQQE